MPQVIEKLQGEVSSKTSSSHLRWYFTFFVISGCCGLIYEVVWLRLAMASFGVTTAMVSIVIAMFMAGLGLGSWGSGLFTRRAASGRIALRLYGSAELLVAVSSILVPYQLKAGRSLLLGLNHIAAWQGSIYYLLASLWIALTLIPWCACMGSTFPLLLAVIGSDDRRKSERSFSYLYVANVAGALLGTAASAFVLIELLGFTRTLWVAGLLNTSLAIGAFLLSSRLNLRACADKIKVAREREKLYGLPDSVVLAILFTTGFVSMGMEVVWIRQFTPYLGNVVYAFAGIVAVYLIATVVGSQDYRSWISSHKTNESIPAWSSLALFAVIPVIAADPLLPLRIGGAELGGLRLSSIVLFCALAGFLTPLLLDSWSGGDPDRAGTAYAVNVVGCILGPLVAGFWLLPSLGERRSLMILAFPLFVIAAAAAFSNGFAREALRPWRAKLKLLVMSVAVILLFGVSHDYETKYPQRVVRRDYAATVIATGTGMRRHLLVNGIGMTLLTPITKYMAHLPLAFMSRPPQNGLVICFGMGTTFRSMLSWGIPTTVVDLVPSVPEMFSYYHSDAQEVLRNPLGHIVIDDGRRFLDSTNQQYDVIVVDPPPPPEAAGSSLLYSRDFYDVVKKHLRSGGVLQMWYPAAEGDQVTASAVAKAIQQSFPHVRVFPSFVEHGYHFLASLEVIPAMTSSELAARMPNSAALDFLEWGPETTVERQFDRVVSKELNMQEIIAVAPLAPAIRDDRPINEYFLLRDWFGLQK